MTIGTDSDLQPIVFPSASLLGKLLLQAFYGTVSMPVILYFPSILSKKINPCKPSQLFEGATIV
jgi:hypothetical protein